MTVDWTVIPLSAPVVLTNCGRCGAAREFLCSGKFRVNAQRKNLDVWLIYKCRACASTWNMTILSRVSPRDIGGTLYSGFLENSPELAMRYAFDTGLHRKNGVRACYDDMAYRVEGDVFPFDALKTEDVTLRISAPFSVNLRLDKLLRERLGLSRTRLEDCFRRGDIACADTAFNPDKPRLILKDTMELHFFQSSADILASPATP